ncbi:class I SAM-dependent methyltransferase [Phenylobacterium sp.]|uniref:class I SAM-dependent methyltransferase n=1 Tax=Phenylobacterium sp. TaxID=1871053 RepID=UPI003568DF35
MLKTVDYDQRQHTVYAQGRAIAPQVTLAWMEVFARHLPRRRPLELIDLGSGSGRFAPALADAFGGPVRGVEPSAGMRGLAEASAAHPQVAYLEGDAARIPLPDASADGVLMFLSYHHVPDRAAAAVEIARVLKPGGRLLIRSTFADTMPQLWWHQFFPSARRIELEMFPSVAEVAAAFTPVGLMRVAFDSLEERFAGNAAEMAARLRLRAISTFEHIGEAEIEAGFARLDAYVAADDGVQPIVGRSDLLVLG